MSHIRPGRRLITPRLHASVTTTKLDSLSQLLYERDSNHRAPDEGSQCWVLSETTPLSASLSGNNLEMLFNQDGWTWRRECRRHQLPHLLSWARFTTSFG
ncbi:hypothetical protein Pmani_018602 [Petrolisthes manimaculis]|uniref:Uncharacterized protein n=1 Tax=Petrolisthes manimaculis TaxID=1843537 RepID=A0AAE1U6J2_9EUCA|nr:hypothetical protein Pmani_018602 [Petrolisthes manimaculis]